MYAIARSATLELPTWRQMVTALSDVFDRINATADVLCGKSGEGAPTITDERITFNGNLYGRYWWTAQGRPRTDMRDDAHEDFDLIRALPSTRLQGMFHTHVTTLGKPYAVGVRATLILARHFYPHETLITTAPATMNEWHAAWELVAPIIPGIALPPECKPSIRLDNLPVHTLRFITQPRRAV